VSRAKTKRKATYSIGEAVEKLQSRYPDLSISKVRYLEDEGLLTLKRTKGGYRLFADEDVSRLSEILRLQKEHFLPLTVIKGRMKGWRVGRSVIVDDGTEGEEESDGPTKPIPLSVALKKAGAGSDTVKMLESFGLIELEKKGDGFVVSESDFEILNIFMELSKFGIEPRHLRMYENQAQRETLLFQQIITPQLRHQSSKTRARTAEELRELVIQTEKLKRIVLRKALRAANLWD